MPSKYKIRLIRANLVAAALILALLTADAPLTATCVLWLTIGSLLFAAVVLDFSHRRTPGSPWQLLAGVLLLCLIAAAPERHSLLIWAWAAVFMLPQNRWITACNASATLASWWLVADLFSPPEWLLLLLTLSILAILALSRSQHLADINGAVRQRSRLIPGFNIWAKEQLLRDLNREQKRAEREAIHAELVVIQVKPSQLWPLAQKLCELIFRFENVYYLNRKTLAAVLLSPTPEKAAQRRTDICAVLSDNLLYQHLTLTGRDLSTLSNEALIKLPTQHLRKPI